MEHALKTVLTRVFAELADGVLDSARECRNDAAKEALYEVAGNMELVDLDRIIKDALAPATATPMEG